jgi:hypothetical protein
MERGDTNSFLEKDMLKGRIGSKCAYCPEAIWYSKTPTMPYRRPRDLFESEQGSLTSWFCGDVADKLVFSCLLPKENQAQTIGHLLPGPSGVQVAQRMKYYICALLAEVLR